MKRFSYFKRPPISVFSQEINKEKEKSPEDPIQRSIERLRNYSPSPPNNRKSRNKKQISSSLNKYKQNNNDKDQKRIGTRLRRRRWLNSISPSTKSHNNEQNIRASVSSESQVLSDKSDKNNKLNQGFSRSRSRFSSKSQDDDADYCPSNKKRSKRGRWKKTANTHTQNDKNIHNNSNILHLSKKRGRHKKTQSVIKLSDLLAQFQKTHSQNGIFANEEESSGSVVSEKEIVMRKQINEDRVRKFIGKIDAPSYSIDPSYSINQNIVYFKDLDNVMQREDIFDDLMAGFFAGSPKKKEENQNLNQEPDENLINKVIVVHENNEIENKTTQPKKENSPAFKFIPKESEEKNEWLEKKWSLCKHPFQKNHFINSVSTQILDNPRNEKDISGIEKHFLHLKYI